MYRDLIFDPDPLFQDFRTEEEKLEPCGGDRRDGKVYDYPESLVLAINVALATGRPLLLRGEAGCGKSSVAYNIARVMNRCYFEKVVTSRMEARDLLWRFDTVRRLGDAQVARFPNDADERPWRSHYPYIEPEIFWWVFDEASARRRGFPKHKELPFEEAQNPVVFRPDADTPAHQSVILIDEIDKAEPDVPNNLLVVLGSMQFHVEEIQKSVTFENGPTGQLLPEQLPLLVITTNEERQLPPAFLRRCIVYRFEPADKNRLARIAEQSVGPAHGAFYETIADAMEKLAIERMGAEKKRAYVSIAEYLDAVRASIRLGSVEDTALIKDIIKRTTWKSPSQD